MAEMYVVEYKKVGKQQAISALENDVSVLDVWPASVTHADRLAVKGMEEKLVFRDMDMYQRFVLDDFALCIEKTMKSTPMPPRNRMESRPGAGIHINVADLEVQGIVVYITSLCPTEGNGRDEWTSCTIKKGIQTFLI